MQQEKKLLRIKGAPVTRKKLFNCSRKPREESAKRNVSRFLDQQPKGDAHLERHGGKPWVKSDGRGGPWARVLSSGRGRKKKKADVLGFPHGVLS